MDSELQQHEQRLNREMSERIYNAVATVLDAEFAVRQNWGLSSLHDEAAGAAADAAMAVLAGKAAKDEIRFKWMVEKILTSLSMAHPRQRFCARLTMELLGIAEEDLAGPGDSNLLDLFRAAVDRQAAKP